MGKTDHTENEKIKQTMLKITNEDLIWYYHGVTKTMLKDIYHIFQFDFELFEYKIDETIYNEALNW